MIKVTRYISANHGSAQSNLETSMRHLLWTLSFFAVAALFLLAEELNAQRAPTIRAVTVMDNFVGTWTMSGTARGKPVAYDLEGKRILDGRYVELHMTDVQRPPKYEARVFIGEDTVTNHIIVHWLDSFGAAYSVPPGTGTISGDTLVFHVPYPDGDFRDTFVYHRENRTWSFLLESSD